MINALERQPALRLLVLAVLATVLTSIPVLGVVLNWYETFFHELSHGVMALLTGGSVARMELNLDGSGMLWSGGSLLPALVTFAGYPGAVLSGIALYLAIESGGAARSRHLALGLALLVLLCAFLWMRDAVSMMIAIVLAGLLAAAWHWGTSKLVLWLARLVSVNLILSGVHSIFNLIGWRGHSDAAKLGEMFYLPVVVFPLIWLAMTVWAIWWLWRREVHRGRTSRRRY